jgi:predicted dehydrogenase
MALNRTNRRDFMRRGVGAAAIGVSGKVAILEAATLWASPRAVPPSDTVRFASIGTGVRGCELLQATRVVPGVECVATCDVYDTRSISAHEALGDKEVAFARDYRQILDRKDIDAVIIAAPDHQHRPIAVAACEAGKDVYCEKPMSHSVDDGFAMVEAAQKNKRVLQAGSQRVSSIIYAKAREIYSSGKLGQVTMIEAHWDRNTPGGAWVVPVPPDASERTIDWEHFLGDAPKRPFDPVRYASWRRFTDYGSGLAGDLFVHMLSGIHYITGTNAPPRRAQSAGGLFRWKEQREFPDLLVTLFEYPSFRVSLRCNQNNESGEYLAFFGTEGTLVIRDIVSMPAYGFGSGGDLRSPVLSFTPQDTRPAPESYSVFGWPKAMREDYFRRFRMEHPLPGPLESAVDQESESFLPPPGYSDVPDHVANFFNSVRTREPPVENEVFGNNAALGCHLANYAYFQQTVAKWDEETRRIKG